MRCLPCSLCVAPMVGSRVPLCAAPHCTPRVFLFSSPLASRCVCLCLGCARVVVARPNRTNRASITYFPAADSHASRSEPPMACGGSAACVSLSAASVHAASVGVDYRGRDPQPSAISLHLSVRAHRGATAATTSQVCNGCCPPRPSRTLEWEIGLLRRLQIDAPFTACPCFDRHPTSDSDCM